MRKRLIVFDLYNTLIRSKRGNGSSYEDVLIDLGVDRAEIFPFIRDNIMNRDLDINDIAIELFNHFKLNKVSADIERLCDLWQEDNNVEWIPGVIDLLGLLQYSNKYSICLMTNVSKPGWMTVSSKFKLEDIFDYCFVSWREGICKPDPRCWEILMRNSNLNSNTDPWRCWMIGDRFEDDLLIPKQSGWNTFLIKNYEDDFKKLSEILL